MNLDINRQTMQTLPEPMDKIISLLQRDKFAVVTLYLSTIFLTYILVYLAFFSFALFYGPFSLVFFIVSYSHLFLLVVI